MELNLRDELISIFSEAFELASNSSIESLNRKETDVWDSFAHLRLIVELEQVFEISINDEEVTSLYSFKDVEDLILSKRIGKHSGEVDENRDMCQNLGRKRGNRCLHS